MAQAMPPSLPFQPESSRPMEREKEQLPLKSCADTLETEPDGIEVAGQIQPTQFVGKGEAERQRSPPFSQPRHRKSGSLRVNGAAKQSRPQNLVVEDSKDTDGGQSKSSKLTFDEEPKPERSQTELVSGRRAGARWERSRIRFAPLSIPLQRRLQTLM
ncbi:MAG: hypothetical protein Q9173_006832, partial [Seirophora scorigena]